MKQSENSYTTLKNDLEKEYQKHRNIFNVISFVFVIVLVFCIYYSFGALQDLKYNNKDWEVKKLMWSTQDALDKYYEQYQKYPDDLQEMEIRHPNDTFKIVSSNEIEYLGYKIFYTEIDTNDYKLETYFKGPRYKGKYILYKDKR